ncbi:MAG: ADP-glyceromanno-heptose 6-epimerase [bacterium]|nr:ADP-glyceromanno-heptose 6-epimerase [bacterium]
MLIVTGGAGFIGSSLIWELNQREKDRIIVVDSLDNENYKNLVGLTFYDYIDKDDFLQKIGVGDFKKVEAIFHLGACSDTTSTEAKYLIKNNYEYSKTLAIHCLLHNIRFIYASSAATYGDGNQGFSDDENRLPSLKPLNLYGYSKHLFDLWAKKEGLLDRIVGLKYFNVFGPNEYHKGNMQSMVLRGFHQIIQTGKIRLFKSYREGIDDGEQKRDFLYVKDAVKMTLFFFENLGLSGIFNLGSGCAETWNALAYSLFSALKIEPNIEYIDMPKEMKDQYQYFTEAILSKIRNAGYIEPITSLSEAIFDYAGYLKDRRYISEDLTEPRNSV